MKTFTQILEKLGGTIERETFSKDLSRVTVRLGDRYQSRSVYTGVGMTEAEYSEHLSQQVISEKYGYPLEAATNAGAIVTIEKGRVIAVMAADSSVSVEVENKKGMKDTIELACYGIIAEIEDWARQ